MEMIILKDGLEVNVEEYQVPKTINEDMNELKSIFPFLVENVDKISFLTKMLKNG